MAENSTSSSPKKLLGTPSGGGGDSIATPNPQNSNLPSPQIPPSPSISDLSGISSPQIPQTQPQINPIAPLDYSAKQSLQPQSQQQHQLQAQQQQQLPNLQQQQQSLMPPSTSFQLQQGLLRPGSMPRLNQIQQRFGAALAASAMRQQHASAYSGQMNFGGVQIQQQQQQMAAGMSRAGTMGQAGQLSMLPGQTMAHLNLQAQMLAQVIGYSCSTCNSLIWISWTSMFCFENCICDECMLLFVTYFFLIILNERLDFSDVFSINPGSFTCQLDSSLYPYLFCAIRKNK